MNSTITEQADERGEYIAGLRDLADWLEANPHLPLPWTGSTLDPFQLGAWLEKTEIAAIARALPGPVRKEFNTSTMGITATFRGLYVRAYAGRDEVCERVVVGTEQVAVPAVEAQPERVEEREIVEWRCHPLLADEQAETAEAVSR